eukprot:TRINITY_DN79_c0_g1::TRINITY_DN79_c0_g1_i1::g.14717::m.14717 TRINITY_DN79_c0_g1::TRINITY_DN79_c0_g1_i1::g.14717  ORF type:complete len:202 (+),score=4.31,AGTRAP/PF06396.6/8.9e-20 TRINITY_DN79_c0_g1_i1:52-657(+)
MASDFSGFTGSFDRFHVSFYKLTITHTVLYFWSILYPFQQLSFVLSNFLLVILGIWASHNHTHSDCVYWFGVLMFFTIINDVICLALYEHDFPLKDDKFKFSLVMAIVHLIFKVFSLVFTHSEYTTRGGKGLVPNPDAATSYRLQEEDAGQSFPRSSRNNNNNFAPPPPSTYYQPFVHPQAGVSTGSFEPSAPEHDHTALP